MDRVNKPITLVDARRLALARQLQPPSFGFVSATHRRSQDPRAAFAFASAIIDEVLAMSNILDTAGEEDGDETSDDLSFGRTQ
jgi:hypothetical protein